MIKWGGYYLTPVGTIVVCPPMEDFRETCWSLRLVFDRGGLPGVSVPTPWPEAFAARAVAGGRVGRNPASFCNARTVTIKARSQQGRSSGTRQP